MKPRRSTRSGWGTGLLVLSAFGMLLLAMGGTGFLLWRGGFFDRPVPAPNREGMVAVPALARAVNAYEAVGREDLLHPQTNQLHVIWVPKEQGQSMLRDLGQVLGRVLRRDKKAGLAFTERDFFPAGTRPGIAAGIPAGMRAMTVDVSRIPGLELLRQGDQFDVYSVLPSQGVNAEESNIEHARLLGGIKPPDTRTGQLARQKGVRLLVRGGAMVAVTQGKSQSTAGARGLTVPPAGARAKTTAATRATIAVSPAEVTPLTEALGIDVQLMCVARSGLPDDEEEEQGVDLSGMVAVVAVARDVPAHAALNQEDLADRETGRLNVFYFPPDAISEEWITDFGGLLGRVVKRPIRSGEILTEAELHPIGTRPGVLAAAPAESAALTVAAERIRGLSQLQPGDHFMLCSTLPDTLDPGPPLTDWAALHGGVPHPDEEMALQERRSGVRTVVDDATYLGTAPAYADRNASSQPADAVRDAAEQDCVIAIPQAAVIRVTQLLQRDTELFALAKAEAPPSSETEDQQVSPAPRTPQPFQLAAQREPQLDNESNEEEADDAAADQPARESTARPAPRGRLPFPVTTRPVEAFSRLKVEDFVDPATGSLRVLYFAEDQIEEDWISDPRQLIDRVTSEPLEPGRVVRQNHLLPTGARPGAAAAIPPGREAITLTSEQVEGLDSWSPQDEIDLVMAQPISADEVAEMTEWASETAAVFAQPQASDVFRQASIRPIAHKALIVSRRSTKVDVTVSAGDDFVGREVDMGGQLVRENVRRERVQIVERDLQVFTLAIAPSEAPAVAAALSTGARLFAVARSAHSATQDQDATIPELDPIRSWVQRWSDNYLRYRSILEQEPPPRKIEHIRGQERTTEYWQNGQRTAAPPVNAANDRATARLMEEKQSGAETSERDSH